MKSEKGLSDLDILKKHQVYEFDYLQKTPTPLRKLVELGPRVKPEGNGQPSFTFYLWEVVDPQHEKKRWPVVLARPVMPDIRSAWLREQMGIGKVSQF